jgi:hypothetical protein
METAIFNTPEIFPGFPYPSYRLVNFMYEPIGGIFSLTLDGFNGYATFKPNDSYSFRMWLAAHHIREHNPHLHHIKLTTKRMEKEWMNERNNFRRKPLTEYHAGSEEQVPNPLPEHAAAAGQKQLKKEKAEAFFRNLLLAFALLVGITFALIMLYVTIIQWYFPLSH